MQRLPAALERDGPFRDQFASAFARYRLPAVANTFKNNLYDNLVATYRFLRDRNMLDELPRWMRPRP